MFCPSCGVANPDESKFCNQCGNRIAEASAQGAAQQAPPAAAPVVASSQGGSSQGAPPAMGMITQDTISRVVTGPTKRQITLGGAAIAIAGIALGALTALKARPQAEVPPVTQVGLIGDPTPVTPPQTEENDAGTVVPIDPARRPAPRLAQRAAHNPAAPAPAPAPRAPAPPRNVATGAPAAPNEPATEPDDDPGDEAPGTTTTASGNTVTRDSAGNMVVNGPDGRPLVRVDRTPAAPGANTPPAPTAPPPAENGVIEHGPRNSEGFTQGEQTDATGTMNPTAFQFVYQHYQSQIASCYASASRNHEGLSGVTVVRVRIAGEDGRVRSTRIVSDSTRNADLQACVQNRIRSWRYPQPEGGDVEVDYPLRFGGAH